jgi:serine/threonine protein kinase
MSRLAGAVSDKGKLVNLYFAVAQQQDKPVAGISSLRSDIRFVKYLMPCEAGEHSGDCRGPSSVLDFGIAKLLTEGQAMETELTQMGGRALTPDYAAPEQIAGASITTAADVYAFGVMLHELLTGERP